MKPLLLLCAIIGGVFALSLVLVFVYPTRKCGEGTCDADDRPQEVRQGPKIIDKTSTVRDLVYFRDDVSELCYAYFVGVPQSLVVVPCSTIRW